MGPIEILFLVLIAVFGIVGAARGFRRELGVTLMLLVVLFLIEFAESRFETQLNQLFAAAGGASSVATTKAITYTVFFLVVAFISYQGETLSFPGVGSSSPVLAALAGLLNGYLFQGSVWYYLDRAGWPLLVADKHFTPFYLAAVKVLPPAVLDWPYLIIVVAAMLILRVWK